MDHLRMCQGKGTSVRPTPPFWGLKFQVLEDSGSKKLGHDFWSTGTIYIPYIRIYIYYINIYIYPPGN